jgi:hypothetical protein
MTPSIFHFKKENNQNTFELIFSVTDLFSLFLLVPEMPWLETSAKSSAGVEEAFSRLVKMIKSRLEKESPDGKAQKGSFTLAKEEKSKKCCLK